MSDDRAARTGRASPAAPSRLRWPLLYALVLTALALDVLALGWLTERFR